MRLSLGLALLLAGCVTTSKPRRAPTRCELVCMRDEANCEASGKSTARGFIAQDAVTEACQRSEGFCLQLCRTPAEAPPAAAQ
jgi:hypothetical protein